MKLPITIEVSDVESDCCGYFCAFLDGRPLKTGMCNLFNTELKSVPFSSYERCEACMHMTREKE